MSETMLRIGTRGSPLALRQADELRRRLAAAHAELAAQEAIQITVIRTTGDRVTDRTLAAIGGKGLFTKEIEEALLAGAIDLAVHSMKDVATFLPDGLVIDCVLPREDPRDAFFSADGRGIGELEPDAVVGTASLRRQAQLLHARPDLRIVPLRGNVETRLAKLAAGAVDATLLAMAGLKRLGLPNRPTCVLSPDIMLPAAAQGAIGVERRADDARAGAWLAPLSDAASLARITAERAFLAALDGSCSTPIAALAEITAGGLELRGLILKPDGSSCHTIALGGAVADAERLGHEAGTELKHRAGPGFFAAPRPEFPAL
jgi:hydroxymethylbilane synthase